MTRREGVFRLLLGGILVLQAVLSLRLRNTAFQDEALYLTAGRLLDHNIGHGLTPDQYGYTAYFSGSPYLYPLGIHQVDALGGLAAARAVSLVCVLAATVLVCGTARSLWSQKAGLCAAAAFAVPQSTQVLGNFATYDAFIVLFLAVLARLAAASAARPWLLAPAVPVAGLMVAFKYASALYLPTVVAMAVLVARTSWPRALARGAVFGLALCAVVAGVLFGLDALRALQSTTTGRGDGGVPASTLLAASGRWLGPTIVAAALGVAAALTGDRAAVPSRVRNVLLCVVLFATLLLAPAYHLHLHTDVSLFKHVGFGLVFAAPLAGLALARLTGAHLRFPLPAIAVGVGLLWAGTHEAEKQYASWVNSSLLNQELDRVVPAGGKVLTEIAETPAYYLYERTPPTSVTSFYYLLYRDTTGPEAYRMAVADAYFDVIVLDRQASHEISGPLQTQLRDAPRYRLAAKLPFRTSRGAGDYEVWIRLPG
ncbi:DUF3824 domain-containing protein [Actinocorallia lasiicapitis]